MKAWDETLVVQQLKKRAVHVRIVVFDKLVEAAGLSERATSTGKQTRHRPLIIHSYIIVTKIVDFLCLYSALLNHIQILARPNCSAKAGTTGSPACPIVPQSRGHMASRPKK